MDFFNWPFAAAIIGGIAIVALREPLGRLLDRVKSAGKEGVNFGSPQDSTAQVPSLKFVEMISMPLCQSALAREESIKAELEQLKITDPLEQAKVLSRAFAALRVDFDFEAIYYVIFGSQLAFVHRLAGLTAGAGIQDSHAFFAVAKARHPEFHAMRTADEWLEYLVARRLVTVSNESIAITQFGRDFLKYLIDQGLPHIKYG